MERRPFDPLTGQPIEGQTFVLEVPPNDLSTLLAWIKKDDIRYYLPALHQLIDIYPQAEETIVVLQNLRRIPSKGMLAFETIGQLGKQELANLCLQVAFSQADYPAVRSAALMSLCRLGVNLRNHRGDLFIMLSDTFIDLRMAAAAALAQMNIPQGWHILLQGLQAEDVYEQLTTVNFLEVISTSCPPSYVQSGIVRWLETAHPRVDGADRYIRKRLIVYLLQYPLSKRLQVRLKNLFSRWIRQEQKHVEWLFRYLRSHLAGQPFVVGQTTFLPSSRYKPSNKNKILNKFIMNCVI